MIQRNLIIMLLVAAVLVGAGFYFKDAILSGTFWAYNNFQNNLQEFKKTDISSLINEVKNVILAPTPLNVGGKENNVVLVKAKIIAQTNIQRYNNGQLPPLIENAQLNAAAKAKAEDILKNQYFEHVSPSGVDPGTLVKSFGYEYIVTGENLILGNFKDEQEVVQKWMDSPGHRANILNDRFTDIGVAVLKGTYKGQTVWVGVQEFGLPLSSCTQPNLSLKGQIDTNKHSLDQLSTQIDAKKAELENTNPKSSQYNVLVDQYNSLVNQYNQLFQTTKSLISEYNIQINTFNQCVAGP